MGIGFAIPISTARQVLESIVAEGQVRRGWIGVEPREITPEITQTFGLKSANGVVVTGVLLNGPAAKAGMEPGDVIATGTPAGVGWYREPKVLLHDGDVMAVEIEGIGRLENPCREVRTG